jgi:hypothetical protein
MPTLVDLVGLPPSVLPPGIDGRSVAPLWRGNSTYFAPDSVLYWEFCTIIEPWALCEDSMIREESETQHAARVDARGAAIAHGRSVGGQGAWGHAVRMGNWKAVSLALSEPFEL